MRPVEAIETYCYHVFGGQQQNERQKFKKKTTKNPQKFAR